MPRSFGRDPILLPEVDDNLQRFMVNAPPNAPR